MQVVCYPVITATSAPEVQKILGRVAGAGGCPKSSKSCQTCSISFALVTRVSGEWKVLLDNLSISEVLTPLLLS